MPVERDPQTGRVVDLIADEVMLNPDPDPVAAENEGA